MSFGEIMLIQMTKIDDTSQVLGMIMQQTTILQEFNTKQSSNLALTQQQDMSAHDALVLTMFAVEDSHIGRTALQKLVYFETVKIPSSIYYRPHYYGPFSRDVAVALENLVTIDCLDEEVTVIDTHESYRYIMKSEWKKLVREDERTKCQQYETILDIVKKCDEFCRLQANILSYAAKAFHILTSAEQNGIQKVTIDDVKQIGKNFEWNLSSDDTERGLELLSQINLVRRS